MQHKHIANRYQITKHMRYVGETHYYDAIDTITQTPVTLRTINISENGAVGIGLDHLAADKLRRKMENEQQIIDKLNHPGLLQLIDYGFDDPFYYHIYPVFVFDSLQMQIERLERIPVWDMLNYMLHITDTLGALHDMGIVHCDISAENILILDKRIKIIEFTIANYDQHANVVSGNPPYMSPEAIRGVKPAVARDIWSLGVTLYYALTGVLPFGDISTPRHEGVPQLFQKILQETPVPMTHIVAELPLVLDTLIHKMLAKDPDKRISNMQNVNAEIRAIITK